MAKRNDIHKVLIIGSGPIIMNSIIPEHRLVKH